MAFLDDVRKRFAAREHHHRDDHQRHGGNRLPRNEQETEFDKTGRVTKEEVKEYSFFYLNGEEVSTLTKKDGKPLSDEEQKKENEKTQKEIAEIQKNAEKKEAKQEKSEEKDKEKEEDDDVGIEVFLRVAQFVNPRRERFHGQDVLVFDFEPNRDFKPRKLVEKIAHQLAGVIWIDEQAHDVARLEAYFIGDFRFGGGVIANLQKGTSFAFEQAYINNEVWLPTYQEAHVGVRFLLLKGFKINEITHYSDYKKFNVDSVATIGKPNANQSPESADPEPSPVTAMPKPQ